MALNHGTIPANELIKNETPSEHFWYKYTDSTSYWLIVLIVGWDVWTQGSRSHTQSHNVQNLLQLFRQPMCNFSVICKLQSCKSTCKPSWSKKPLKLTEHTNFNKSKTLAVILHNNNEFRKVNSIKRFNCAQFRCSYKTVIETCVTMQVINEY